MKKLVVSFVLVLLCIVSFAFLNTFDSAPNTNNNQTNPPNNNDEIFVSDIWHSAVDENNNFISVTSDLLPADVIKIPSLENAQAMDYIYSNLSDSNSLEYYGGYTNFNCYAYVLGLTDNLGANGFNQMQFGVGAFSNISRVNLSTLDVLNAVLQDLTSSVNPSTGTDALLDPAPLNKEGVYWTTEIPDVENLGNDEQLFCFRLGVSADSETAEYYDYHFMKYNKADNSWSHKFGTYGYVYRLKEDVTPWSATNKLGESAWWEQLSSSTPIFIPVEFNGPIVYVRYKNV